MAVKKSSRVANRNLRPVEIEGRLYDRTPAGRLIVEGHQLSDAQEREFRAKVQERMRIAMGSDQLRNDPESYAHKAGLSDTLWKYRPRVRAKEELLSLSMRISDISLSISSMRDFSFYQDGYPNETVCKMLENLVTEASRRLAKLQHFSESMKLERSTKLHQWTARLQKFEAM